MNRPMPAAMAAFSSPGRHRERHPADDAHQDGHHRRDEGGDPGDRRDAEQLAVGVRRGADDERVEHDDVGHRREGGQPGEHLALDGRAPPGDLEEAVETAALGGFRRLGRDSRILRSHAHGVAYSVPGWPAGRAGQAWGCSRPGAVGPENVGTAGLHGSREALRSRTRSGSDFAPPP
jgi:hypothetical protein